MLLFALNLVTLLVQIQCELNKLLIVSTLQRCWKIKKTTKKFSLDLNGENFLFRTFQVEC